MWNRVANLRGEPGRNIALDLLNEFHNNQFKGITMLTVFKLVEQKESYARGTP